VKLPLLFTAPLPPLLALFVQEAGRNMSGIPRGVGRVLIATVEAIALPRHFLASCQLYPRPENVCFFRSRTRSGWHARLAELPRQDPLIWMLLGEVVLGAEQPARAAIALRFSKPTPAAHANRQDGAAH
jgi:hypothetical protein